MATRAELSSLLDPLRQHVSDSLLLVCSYLILDQLPAARRAGEEAGVELAYPAEGLINLASLLCAELTRREG